MGTEALVYSLVDTLFRQETHTFCAFVTSEKAFDAACVKASLVRLAQIGVTSGGAQITNFLVDTVLSSADW